MQIIQPALHFPPELLLQAQGIKVVFFDVDGVLTDGGLYFSEQGETLKRFSTLDGHGLKLLKQAGITPVIITGRDSAPLRVRLKALGIEHAKFGTEDKLPAAEDFLKPLALDGTKLPPWAMIGPICPCCNVLPFRVHPSMPTHKHWPLHTLSQAAKAALAPPENCVICWCLQVGNMHPCLRVSVLHRPHDEFIPAPPRSFVSLLASHSHGRICLGQLVACPKSAKFLQ
jgi:3-deoxy-D-manno-octulosonate 8-phosphate phosphatase (KDO 8-P phosphatase)